MMRATRISSDFAGRVAQLDFSMLKRKLMSRKHGEGWSLDQAKHVEREYRRFLILLNAHPGQEIVPTKEVDTFWHYHILDTRAYSCDMIALFGRMLHHYPYFGIDDVTGEAELYVAFERTKALYELEFSEPMIGFGASCDSDGASCSGSCKN